MPSMASKYAPWITVPESANRERFQSRHPALSFKREYHPLSSGSQAISSTSWS